MSAEDDPTIPLPDDSMSRRVRVARVSRILADRTRVDDPLELYGRLGDIDRQVETEHPVLADLHAGIYYRLRSELGYGPGDYMSSSDAETLQAYHRVLSIALGSLSQLVAEGIVNLSTK